MNFLCKSLSVVGVDWMTTTCRSFSAASSDQINWRHCISMSYGDCSWDHELHRDDHHESWWSFSLPSLPISPVSLSTSPLPASWSSLQSSTSARRTSSLVNQHGNEFNVFLLGSNGPCSSIFRPAPCLLCLFSSIRKLTFYCCLDTYRCCPGMTSDEALQEFGDIQRGTSKEYNNLMGSRRISEWQKKTNMKLPGKPWCFVIFGNVKVPAIDPD